MRIAILVLASAAPAVLSAMIDSLQHEAISFFIHVDKKVSEDPYFHLKSRERVSFLSNRQEIYWGGFNMILAEILLLEAAILHRFDRYLLVSDNSFPLKDADGLLLALKAETQWIGFKTDPGTWPRQRYDEFFYLDSPSTDRRGATSKLGTFDDRDRSNILALAKLINIGKAPLDALYHGSQWWALTAEAAEHTVFVHKHDHHLRESFRFSEIPDEQYVQTIVGNGKNGWEIRNTAMWTDFGRDPKPYVFSDLTEIQGAQASEYLFIRKVSDDPFFLESLIKNIKIIEG